MATVIFVVLLVLAVVAANALLGIPVIVWFRRKRTASLGVLGRELVDTDEQTQFGPDRAQYRGGTGSHPATRSNGFLQLTDRRLLFLKLAGGRIEIDRSDIATVVEEREYLGHVHPGKNHLVITTNTGVVGFVVTDPVSWVELLRTPLP